MAKTNNHRRFPGESTRCRPDLASARRQEAKQRQEEYNALTPRQRLDKLDMKFGAGVGAKKEREKLMRHSPKSANREVVKTEELATVTIPAELMAEIDAINEELGSKKKVKAKDRRARSGKPTN
jgi:hypothetical protein